MNRFNVVRPVDAWVVRLFFIALAILLVGYMFMGRGFAHVGFGPVYVGEVGLGIGLLATVWAVARFGLDTRPPAVLWLLVAFIALGAVRTVPYLAEYGLDALRDAVLWGYALFALFLYVLVDRGVLRRGMEFYAWLVPLFAAWLPVSWTLFGILSADIDPTRPGEVVPLVFFKSGDMAVHIAGAIGSLTFAASTGPLANRFWWRLLITVPLGWTALVGFATNRGSLVALAVAVLVALVFTWRWRTWAPLLAGGLVALAIFALPSPTTPVGQAPATPSVAPATAAATSTGGNDAAPTPGVPTPTDPPGRQVGIGQVVANVVSIFGSSSDPGLSGTRAFRLAWWSEIVDYTVFGPHFWTGKGFGVNLATDDGFQPTADQSLRAPHNSHMTVLARMGVPGFLLWVALQATWAVGLVRVLRRQRHAGDRLLGAAAGWIGIYWIAMMVNTSFDPYLEGPQGGIWFWTIFGLGLVVMRLDRERSAH